EVEEAVTEAMKSKIPTMETVLTAVTMMTMMTTKLNPRGVQLMIPTLLLPDLKEPRSAIIPFPRRLWPIKYQQISLCQPL
ncbi:hypothetical protein PIB30_111934, partial [Stylosanthes scabra]|nr:hypothetical protein [Stylosanthes scabra]